jgi:hypothetical protein
LGEGNSEFQVGDFFVYPDRVSIKTLSIGNRIVFLMQNLKTNEPELAECGAYVAHDLWLDVLQGDAEYCGVEEVTEEEINLVKNSLVKISTDELDLNFQKVRAWKLDPDALTLSPVSRSRESPS